MSLKKLLLALPVLMTGFAIDATAATGATYNCWQTYLPGQADRGANEYLFLNAKSEDYNAASSSCSHCKGKALVCGHKAGAVLGIGGGIGGDGCYTGAKVIVDGTYTWKDTESAGRTVFECDRNGGNEWYQAGSSMLKDFGNCADSSNYKKGDKYERMFENGDREYYCIYSRIKKAGSGKACIAQWNDAFCYMTKNQSSCYAKKLGYDKQNDTCTCKNRNEIYRDGKCEKDINNLSDQQKCASIGGNWYNGVCKCDDRDYFEPDVKQCLPKSQCNKSAVVCANNVINLSDFGNSTTTVDGGNASVSNSGNSSNTNNNENNNNSKNTNGDNAGGKSGGAVSGCLNRPTALGITCCKAGKATRYFGPKTKSELDRGVNMPESCICLDAAGKDDATKEFDMASLSCVAKGTTQPGIPVACNCTVDLSVVSSAESSCAAQSMETAINRVKVECQKGADCNGQTVSVYVNAIAEAMSSCANQPVEPEKPQLNEQRLAAAVEAIDKYRSGLDVSVWKDAEGNFNTARLVSDSIAGVVLGTAGGLITSSVVKKNQVKNGFEDVVCTIGGQTVGSYGDEISVGIQ